MDKYYTIMVIPEKEKGVKSLKIPGMFFRSLTFIIVLISIILGILAYDYWKIMQQVYENKHLNQENRQLREQLQLFQMKINSLTEDLERIHIFEKKIRIITGMEDIKLQGPLMLKSPEENPAMDDYDEKPQKSRELKVPTSSSTKQDYLREENVFSKEFQELVSFEGMHADPEYLKLKNLYDKKIAENLGIAEEYTFTRQWSELTRQSFALSNEYANFDYKFNIIKDVISSMELKIHEIDKTLLDKESILQSTPTVLPARGWITSYFGQRLSPTAGYVKMHEGIDIGAPVGTNIVAPADGIVTFSGKKPGFGNFVQIDHGYGIETLFAHAHKTVAKAGQRVARGDPVALVGNTGYSTGPHLHYEVRVNGIAVDPLYFVIE